MVGIYDALSSDNHFWLKEEGEPPTWDRKSISSEVAQKVIGLNDVYYVNRLVEWMLNIIKKNCLPGWVGKSFIYFHSKTVEIWSVDTDESMPSEELEG